MTEALQAIDVNVNLLDAITGYSSEDTSCSVST